MKTNKKELAWDQEIIQMCPILYKMHDHDMSETCMCWGFEHKNGWKTPVQKMACALEMLNNQYYPEYRVRIQMDQQKEKYGTLHAYYSVVVDPGKFGCMFNEFFRKIYCKLSKINYKCKNVVDVEPYDYDDKTELTKEEYTKKIKSKYKASNVEYKKEDGKYFEICHLRNYGKSHMAPTKHKFLYKLRNICRKLSYTFNEYGKEHSPKINAIITYMDSYAEEIIRKAEEECYKTCEECGCQIGSDWSPRCETTGWITYICDKCAEKTDYEYLKNGAVFLKDKCIKTKVQREKQLKQIEKKFKNRKCL